MGGLQAGMYAYNFHYTIYYQHPHCASYLPSCLLSSHIWRDSASWPTCSSRLLCLILQPPHALLSSLPLLRSLCRPPLPLRHLLSHLAPPSTTPTPHLRLAYIWRVAHQHPTTGTVWLWPASRCCCAFAILPSSRAVVTPLAQRRGGGIVVAAARTLANA